MFDLTLNRLMESQGISAEALSEKSGHKPEFISGILSTMEYPQVSKYVGLVVAAGGNEEDKLTAKVEWTAIREICEKRTAKTKEDEAKTEADKKAKDEENWQRNLASSNAEIEDYLKNKRAKDVEAAKDAEQKKVDNAKKKTETKVENGAAIEVSADAPAVEEEFNPFNEEG